MSVRLPSLVLIIVASLAPAAAPEAIGQEAPAKPRKVIKTDAEWRKLLTPTQYMVTRQAATEPAGSGKLLNNHAKGTYECVGCSSPLFNSATKFDSGTGWPSFYAPITPKSVDTSTDYKLGYARVEVLCETCGAHLGHVFDDGPPPTGLRYCMNSAALKFERPTDTTKTAKDKAEPKDKKADEKPKEKEKEKAEPAKDAPK